MNGSLWEEAATPHLLASVHLPLSSSLGGDGRTWGRAGQSAKEPVRSTAGGVRPGGAADRPQPGLALVRMLGGRAPGVGAPRRRRRARAESFTRTRAACGQSAQRQVHPPGERAPWLPLSLVGPAGQQRAGESWARRSGRTVPQTPRGGLRRLGLVGEARGKGVAGWFRCRFRPWLGAGTGEARVGGASSARLTWRLRPGAGATWRRRSAHSAETLIRVARRARATFRF